MTDEKKAASVVKMIAVHVGKKPPAESIKLSEMHMPLENPIPGYVTCLFGHNSANNALAEIAMTAKQNGLFFYTATVTCEVRTEVSTGIMPLEQLTAGEVDVVNVGRLKKEAIRDLSSYYFERVLTTMQISKEALEKMFKWGRPIEYMPSFTEFLPGLFERWHVKLVIHPVRFTSTDDSKHHFVASFDPRKVKVLSIVPNMITNSPTPRTILPE